MAKEKRPYDALIDEHEDTAPFYCGCRMERETEGGSGRVVRFYFCARHRGETPTGYKTTRDGDRLTECQGCGRRAGENNKKRVDPVIKDLRARVEAGEIMPAGECLKCGAVVHLIPLYSKR
ncbi:MAG: hypothetical protein KGJ13_09890 [Patescibacteria group bacterium]|nr:hypothetical protein [Patescibacteria group bacterium]